MLRRILRRLCKVLFGHLQVVLCRCRLGIANPFAHHVQGQFLRQFCFPSAAEVLEQLGPRLETRLLDDSAELRSEVRADIAVASNDVYLSRLGLFKTVAQVRMQLREDRHLTDASAGVMLSLYRVYGESGMFPVNISPLQAKHL